MKGITTSKFVLGGKNIDSINQKHCPMQLLYKCKDLMGRILCTMVNDKIRFRKKKVMQEQKTDTNKKCL